MLLLSVHQWCSWTWSMYSHLGIHWDRIWASWCEPSCVHHFFFFLITVKLHLCGIFLCNLFKKSESKVITSRAFYILFPQRNRVIIPQFMWGIGSRTPMDIKICRYSSPHRTVCPQYLWALHLRWTVLRLCFTASVRLITIWVTIF